MATSTGFLLPELNAALDTWKAATGLDTDSPEWGEVLAVMRDCGLLDADRLPQHSLFDGEDAPPPPEHTAAVLRTRLALAASPSLVHDCDMGLSYATALEIMVVLIDRFYGDRLTLWGYDYTESRLRQEVPDRVLVLAESPTQALAYLVTTLAEVADELPPVTGLIVDAARSVDAVALQVFHALDTLPGPEYRIELAPLCDGGWVLYRTNM